MAGGADLQFFFSVRRLLRGESRKAVPTMSNDNGKNQKHIGQDPKYLEKFIDDGDTLEDFEVEPDVFYGVRPPAPISSRVLICVHARTSKFCGSGERVAVRLHRCVWGPSADRPRMVSRLLLLPSIGQIKEQVHRSPRCLLHEA